MTKIVNLYKEPYDVYIGRSGRGKDGYFGNPILINEKYKNCPNERARVLKAFQVYFFDRILRDGEFKNRVLELKDKTLGCFCKPKDCHGDIIVQWLDGINLEEGDWD